MIEEPDSGLADADEPTLEALGPRDLLRGADALNASEASQLLSQAPGRLIVWVGERDSGKTSLNCELYERQRRPGARLCFAGSQTLLGLEARAHPARAASGRTTRATHRTEEDPDGRELLHLALAGPTFRPVHLLLSDLPGEVFRSLRDNAIHPDDVPLLGRADKLALIADGARIADPGSRALVLSNARQLLARLRASGLPHSRTSLALIVTKWDCVQAAGAESYWASRENLLYTAVKDLDATASLHRVAARPAVDWTGDDGMDALADWLLAPNPAPQDPMPKPTAPPIGAPPILASPKWMSP